MARTTINTQVIPDGTIVSADLSYPLTDFSSTGIDDNATSTAVTIDANENVGIGDTPSYRLDVLSSSGDVARIKSSNTRSDLWLQASGTTAGFVRLRASANDLQLIAGNSVGMTLDDTGNVGIGVTDPDVDLEVQSAAGTLKLSNNSAKAATEATVGQVEFAQHFGVNVSSSIAGIEQGGATDYAQGGMIFQTRPSGGSLTERMRIDSSGNVGIGTSGPDAKLDVKASTATVEVAARFRKGSTADTGGHTMLIGLGTEDAAWSKSAIGHQRNAPYDVGDLIFCLNSDAASGSDVSTSHERMRITSAGNVGIGETSPDVKAHISSALPILKLDNTNTILSNGQTVTEIQFKQNDSSGSGTGIVGRIKTISRPRIDSGTYFGNTADLSFFVSADSSGHASDNATKEALTIQRGTGRVIIPSGVTLGTSAAVATTANTLDDYEEGTWTPTLFGTTSGSQSYNGLYTKIGRVVTCHFFIEGTSSTYFSGSLKISGLPFGVANSGSASGDWYFGDVSAYGVNTSGKDIYLYSPANGSTTVELAIEKQDGNVNTLLNSSNLNSSAVYIRGSLTYIPS